MTNKEIIIIKIQQAVRRRYKSDRTKVIKPSYEPDDDPSRKVNILNVIFL